jgi:hypothetical protein
MGYTTDFEGNFDVTPAIQEDHREYLNKFCGTRRMARNAAKASKMDDPVREKVGLPIGDGGGYFVGGVGSYGQDNDRSVTDHNEPPSGQPGLWCQWVPSGDGTALGWDGGEKFYEYVAWLDYLITHFLKPWGYTLSGQVSWSGEESGDQGIIYVKDNKIQAVGSHISNPGPSW